MTSQVISFRFNDDDLSALRAKALPNESDSQTAQRLLRSLINVDNTSTEVLTVTNLDERVNEIVERKTQHIIISCNELIEQCRQYVDSHLHKLNTANKSTLTRTTSRSASKKVPKKPVE